jgi:hypothetical protein
VLSSFGSTMSYTEDFSEEAAGSSSTLSSFDSTFRYTEDVKMFPSPVPDDSSPVPVVSATQPLYQPPTPTSDTPMVSAADHSMDRLYLYTEDSKQHLAFGMNQPLVSGVPQCVTGLPYAFTHYQETAQVPYPYHGSNGFTTCGPVVPHNVTLAGALGPHGLPNSNHMHGLSNSSHMHGLSNSSQMHGVPNSRQMHGLPMHQMPAHDFSTHGMPVTANWNNLDALL